MILPDYKIEHRLDQGALEITPLADPELQIQPASVDLRLDEEFKIATHDPENPFEEYTFEDTLRIEPYEFVLASTVEEVSIPIDVVGHVTGRSSIGRKGVMVHVTAGLCDPGFQGDIVLEMVNVSPKAVELDVGSRVAQLVLTETAGEVENPYGSRGDSHYQGQEGPVESQYGER